MDRSPPEPFSVPSKDGEVVRRVEIMVERRVCSVEVHNNIPLPPGIRCPVCGSLTAAAETSQSQSHVVQDSSGKIKGGY